MVISVGIIFGAVGGTASVKTHYGFTAVGFMAELATGVACNIGHAVYVSAYSRYLPRRTGNAAIIASVFGGASTSVIWLIPLGPWMAIHAGDSTDALLGLEVAGTVPHSPTPLSTATGPVTATVRTCRDRPGQRRRRQ